MPEYVRITDVSPRDGLQNELGVIATHEKIKLVRLLAQTGVAEIEAASFVSPKWIPQLADASDVLLGVLRDVRIEPMVSALVPNEQGMRALLEINRRAIEQNGAPIVRKASVFTAASETFCKKNINATIAESIERFKPIVTLANENRIETRGYISCVFKCPFEGVIRPDQVAPVARMLRSIGVWEIDLGDTIGAGLPEDVDPLVDAVMPELDFGYGALKFGRKTIEDHEYHPLTLHLHDTFGRALDCVLAALDAGVRSFDGSVAGLGGCPYASKKLPDGTIQRAPGNISTELLVRTIHAAGYETGVDLDKLAEAAAYAQEIVAKSRAANSGGVAT